MNMPQDKYENDAQYRLFVDTIENLLHQCQFTPSEVRDASVLACIHFEMRSFSRLRVVPTIINESLLRLEEYRKELNKKGFI